MYVFSIKGALIYIVVINIILMWCLAFWLKLRTFFLGLRGFTTSLHNSFYVMSFVNFFNLLFFMFRISFKFLVNECVSYYSNSNLIVVLALLLY